MQFDARAAKLLAAGQHFTIDDCPGLRLNATATTRTCCIATIAPVDGKIWQAKIGEWPSVSVSAALAEWEKLRKARDSGVDAAEKRQAAAEARANALRGSNGAADARKARHAAIQRLYALQMHRSSIARDLNHSGRKLLA